MNWRLDIDESSIYCGERLVASLDNTEGSNDGWRNALRLGADIVARMNAAGIQQEQIFMAQETEILRLRAALLWIEDNARAGKIEIAPSVRGTGFEFGFWPSAKAVVVAGAASLLDAVEQARPGPEDYGPQNAVRAALG